MRTGLVRAGVVVLVALAGAAHAQTGTSRTPAAVPPAPRASQWDGVYTDAQAARGEPFYVENCSMCHGLNLSGTILAPALAGPAFIAKWNRRPLKLVFDIIQTRMPLNLSGHLSPQQNVDVLAYMLKRGESPAGAKELAPTAAALGAVVVLAKP